MLIGRQSEADVPKPKANMTWEQSVLRYISYTHLRPQKRTQPSQTGGVSSYTGEMPRATRETTTWGPPSPRRSPYDADGSSSRMCPNFNFLRHFLTFANDVNDFLNARPSDREANFNSAGLEHVSRWAQIQLFLFNVQKGIGAFLFLLYHSEREKKKMSGW